jgi:hypothetical protein
MVLHYHICSLFVHTIHIIVNHLHVMMQQCHRSIPICPSASGANTIQYEYEIRLNWIKYANIPKKPAPGLNHVRLLYIHSINENRKRVDKYEMHVMILTDNEPTFEY